LEPVENVVDHGNEDALLRIAFTGEPTIENWADEVGPDTDYEETQEEKSAAVRQVGLLAFDLCMFPVPKDGEQLLYNFKGRERGFYTKAGRRIPDHYRIDADNSNCLAGNYLAVKQGGIAIVIPLNQLEIGESSENSGLAPETYITVEGTGGLQIITNDNSAISFDHEVGITGNEKQLVIQTKTVGDVMFNSSNFNAVYRRVCKHLDIVKCVGQIDLGDGNMISVDQLKCNGTCNLRPCKDAKQVAPLVSLGSGKPCGWEYKRGMRALGKESYPIHVEHDGSHFVLDNPVCRMANCSHHRKPNWIRGKCAKLVNGTACGVAVPSGSHYCTDHKDSNKCAGCENTATPGKRLCGACFAKNRK
jgi:hypothetical protein